MDAQAYNVLYTFQGQGVWKVCVQCAVPNDTYGPPGKTEVNVFHCWELITDDPLSCPDNTMKTLSILYSTDKVLSCNTVCEHWLSGSLIEAYQQLFVTMAIGVSPVISGLPNQTPTLSVSVVSMGKTHQPPWMACWWWSGGPVVLVISSLASVKTTPGQLQLRC